MLGLLEMSAPQVLAFQTIRWRHRENGDRLFSAENHRAQSCFQGPLVIHSFPVSDPGWFYLNPRSVYPFLNFHVLKRKESEIAQLCLTLHNPTDCSLSGSSVHGIFQARVLEWVPISFCRGSFPPRDQARVSHIVGRRFTVWATREANAFMLWASTKNGIHGVFTCLICSNTWVFLLGDFSLCPSLIMLCKRREQLVAALVITVTSRAIHRGHRPLPGHTLLSDSGHTPKRHTPKAAGLQSSIADYSTCETSWRAP